MAQRRLGPALREFLHPFRGPKLFRPSMRVNLIRKPPKPIKRTPIVDLLPEQHGKRKGTTDFGLMISIATARRDALDRLSKSIPYEGVPFTDRLTFKRKDQIVEASMRTLSLHEILQLSHPDRLHDHVYDAFRTLESSGLSIPTILSVLKNIPEILNKLPEDLFSAVEEVMGERPSSIDDLVQQLKRKFNYTPTMLR